MEQFPANNPNPVLSVEKDGTVLYSNEAGELLLHEWNVGIGEKLPSNIRDLVQRVISRNSPEKMEVNVGKRIYQASFHPLPEEECVNIYGFDISDQKELEEKNHALKDEIQSLRARLEEPEEFQQAVSERDLDALVMPVSEQDLSVFTLSNPNKAYRILMETANEDVVIVDAEFKITYAGKRFINKMGYSPEEVIGRSWLDFVDEESKAYYELRMEKRRQGSDESYELKLTHKDGSPLWVLASSKPLFDMDGKFTGVLAMLTDITEHKQAEDALRKVYEKSQGQSEELQVFNEELQVQSEELHEANEALRESEARFRTLAENSPDVITRFDRQNRHTYANPAASEAYGLSQEEIIGKTHGELRRNPELVKFLETYQEIVFTTGKPETMEFHYKLPQRKEYYFNTKIVPEFTNNKVTSILAISRDITDIKEAEAKLKETLDNLENLVKARTTELEKAYNSLKDSERSLAEAQKMAHIGDWEWNIVTGEMRWSDETYRIFGFKPKEFEITYNSFLSHVYSDDREYVDNAFKRALNGERYSIEFRIVLADGVERIVHEEGKVAFDKKNTPIRMMGTIQDITERKQTEKALNESETRLRRFYESGMVGVLYYNLDGSITEANDKFLEMVGYTREDLQAGWVKWDKITPPEYLPLEEDAIAELKATGVATPYEKEYIRKDGSRIPIILGAANIDESRNDGIAFVLDITERKKADEYLAKIEIARKQEIHHRIKNNLQVISSLLDLQAEQFRDQKCIKDSEVLQAFRESQDRVTSMALIHEELYKGGGFDTLDFSPYIEELTENLFLTYRLGNKDISLKMDLDENLFFDMDTAVPLGMIVNELVSNSLKHAFKGKAEGNIRIKLCREEIVECMNSREESKSEDCESAGFILTVSDDGIGIPENLEIENLDSLGFQLVTTLVDQLDGELEFKRNNGTEFTMRFTVPEHNNQASSPAPQQLVE